MVIFFISSQFATIKRQLGPDEMKFFMWAYKDAASSLHSYLILNMKSDTEERFRVQSNIFKDPQHVYIT